MSQRTRVYIHFPDTDKLDIYMNDVPRKGEFFNWNDHFYEIYLVMWTRVETEVRVHLYCKRKKFERNELNKLEE